MSVAFDTLKYANELEAVNFSKDQAEKLAILQKEIIDNEMKDFVTKDYLDNVVDRLVLKLVLIICGFNASCIAIGLTILGFILHK